MMLSFYSINMRLVCNASKALRICILVVGSLNIQAQDFTCNLLSDTCTSKEDFQCDSESTCKEMSDCYDCNYITCRQFSYDCEGCLNAKGCFWCASDAKCYNSQHYGENPPDYVNVEANTLYYIGRPRKTACSLPEDFLSGSSSKGEDISVVCSNPDHFFSDPLYTSAKWIFDMINVLPVYEKGFTGKGIRVRINDDGVDKDNEEFKDRYDSDASCDIDGPLDETIYNGIHGTSVASIVAAAGNNGMCSVGIAPNATISSCNLFSYIHNAPEFLIEKLDSFDISQNSWQNLVCNEQSYSERRRLSGDTADTCPFISPEDSNPCQNNACDFSQTILSAECEKAVYLHCASPFTYQQDTDACNEYLHLVVTFCSYQLIGEYQIDEIQKGILSGRDGRGIIYTVASGNFNYWGTDVNMDRLTNSRFTIAVGAVGKDRIHSSYSNPGAALFVTAPGGDAEYRTNIPVANFGGGCRDSGYGTSFSCPIVSGVIALMLEANENLSWRDVQAILASTSQMVDDPNDDTRVTNAAGFQHSNLYGFGILDAEKAVNASLLWEPLNQEKVIDWSSGTINAAIDDDELFETSMIAEIKNPQGVTGKKDLIAESVTVLLDLQHNSRGDLKIVLTSPSNTESILHPGKRIENSMTVAGKDWTLLTVRSRGESAVGKWTLSIRDLREGSVSECANRPFFLPDYGIIGCMSLKIAACKDNGLNPIFWYRYPDDHPLLTARDRESGLTFQEACCACGGGVQASRVTNIVRSWKLLVHGHYVALDEDIMNTTSGAEIRLAHKTAVAAILLIQLLLFFI